MKPSIIVINPNSNCYVTAGLSKALNPYRLVGGPKIECLTNSNGPFGIESELDSESVIPDIIDEITKRKDAGAFVIACYSDPGLEVCRSIFDAPIYGIAEAGILMALGQGNKFGVVAIAEPSIERHIKSIRRMGVIDRLSSERALNITVDETARGLKTFEMLVKVGSELLEDGADVIILGCAGMATHRSKLEKELGKPVVDPTQAAVSMALGNILIS